MNMIYKMKVFADSVERGIFADGIFRGGVDFTKIVVFILGIITVFLFSNKIYENAINYPKLYSFEIISSVCLVVLMGGTALLAFFVIISSLNKILGSED